MLLQAIRILKEAEEEKRRRAAAAAAADAQRRRDAEAVAAAAEAERQRATAAEDKNWRRAAAAAVDDARRRRDADAAKVGAASCVRAALRTTPNAPAPRFTCVCRLLPPPASQANQALSGRRRAATLSSCAITSLQTRLASTSELMGNHTRLNMHICNCMRDCGFAFNMSSSSLFRNWTPLHLSSLQGQLNVCEYLVASKADVNAKITEYGARLHMRFLIAVLFRKFSSSCLFQFKDSSAYVFT